MNIFPILLLILLIYGLVQIVKKNKVKGKVWISRKFSTVIPLGYIVVLVVSAAIIHFIPNKEESTFLPVNQKELDEYSESYTNIYEGEFESINPSLLIRQWQQTVSDNKLFIKPRTLGGMPVNIVIERIPGDSDTIDSFLFAGKLVMDDYEVRGYKNQTVITAKANELTISNKGQNSFSLSYFTQDVIMTQFTSDTPFDRSHSTGEWPPILYLKIPDLIDVKIDDSIKDHVTEK